MKRNEKNRRTIKSGRPFLLPQAVINNQIKEVSFLKGIIQKLPVCVYWKNIDGVYLGCNDYMLDLTSTEIIGKKDSELPWKDSSHKLNTIECEVIQKGKSREIEEYRDFNGTKVYLLTQLGPLFDETGKVTGILGISVDISRLKNMEIELKDSKQDSEFILNNIVANMPGHVYWKDVNGVYLGCNNLQAQSLGLKTGLEVIGKTDFELPWSKESAKIFRENDLRIMQQGVSEVIEEKIIINGKEGVALSHKTPLKNEDGQVVGILGISLDITKRKAAEKALKIARDQAEAASIAKSEFIANMSHDIITPVSGIIGMSKLLETEGESDKDREFGQTIHTSSEQLLSLINDILDLISADETHKDALHYETFSIASRLKLLQDLLTPNIDSKHLNFDVNLDSSVPDLVISDRIKIDRILLNLVSNAIKFTPAGSIRVAVKVLSQHNDDATLAFEVKDTGIGIAKHQIDKIFDRFYRIDPSYHNNYKGHGIGLFIVKRYVELLGGEISVQSKQGEGTDIKVILPVKIGVATKDSNHPEEVLDFNGFADKTRSNQPNITLSTLSSFPRLESKNISLSKVLVIEDDPVARKVAMSMLTRTGFKVDEAEDAELGFWKVMQNHYDLIFTDIGLPGMSGNQFAIMVRTWEKTTNRERVPIIGLTAHGTKQQAAGQEAGIDLLFTKPLDDQKIKTINDHLCIPHTEPLKKQELFRTSEGLGPDLPQTEEELFQLEKYPLLDEKDGLESSGGSLEFLQELLDLLVTVTLPEEQLLLQKAHDKMDWESIQSIAHKIKGGALYCGTQRLRYACQYTERYRLAGHSKLLDPLYDQLLVVINDTVSYLQNWLLKKRT